MTKKKILSPEDIAVIKKNLPLKANQREVDAIRAEVEKRLENEQLEYIRRWVEKC